MRQPRPTARNQLSAPTKLDQSSTWPLGLGRLRPPRRVHMDGKLQMQTLPKHRFQAAYPLPPGSKVRAPGAESRERSQETRRLRPNTLDALAYTDLTHRV